MSDITMEQVGEWLHPKDWELTGLATSSEEYAYLTEHASQVRYDFVLCAAQQVLAEKAAPSQASSDTTDQELFESLPVKNVLGKDLHKKLADQVAPQFTASAIEKRQKWTRLAERQAILGGFVMNTSKYSESLYRDEATFDAAVGRAEALDDYPVRFHMRGVKFIQSAAVDMDSVATWTSQQDPEHMKYLNHPYCVVYKEERYWPEMVRIKEEYDQVHGIKSFADLVRPIVDGVYLAPYIPEEVTASGDFVDIDDVYQAAQRLGYSATHASTVFTRVLSGSIRSNWPKGVPYSHLYYYFDRDFCQPGTSRSGVLFMNKNAVIKEYEHLRDGTNAHKIVATLEDVLDDKPSTPEPTLGKLDQRLIFGF